MNTSIRISFGFLSADTFLCFGDVYSHTDSKIVACCVQGMYGISDQVYLSLPCVLNSRGVSSVVNMTLTDDEVAQLQASANTLWDIQKDLQDI